MDQTIPEQRVYPAEQIVRQATTDDHDQLVALYADCSPFGHSLSYPPHRTEKALAGWLTILLKRGHNLVMGAEHTAAIIGHVVVTPETAAEPELAVFVHPGHRRRDVATELTKHAITYAIDSAYSALRMEVGVVNRPALGVATKLGFEFTEDFEKKNRFDLICLRYALDVDGDEQINTTTET